MDLLNFQIDKINKYQINIQIEHNNEIKIR